MTVAAVGAMGALMGSVGAQASKAEIGDALAWVRTHFGTPARGPLSLEIDGKRFDPTAKGWQAVVSMRPRRGVTQWTVAFRNAESGLRIEGQAITYSGSATVEWVYTLHNDGNRPSPMLSKIQGLDATFASGAAPALHKSLGDSNSGESFAHTTVQLAEGKSDVFAPNGGRSSDGYLPFFNLDLDGRGSAVAVGWSGQWEAAVERTTEREVHVRAGQQLTHLRLQPGETIRTPRMLLSFWRGKDEERGPNFVRKYLLDHVMPRKDGALVMPPICASVGWTAPDGSYEGPHLAVMPNYGKEGVEVFWSDMDPQQWYPEGFPEGTGNWTVDRAKYPNGLGVIGDAAHRLGLGYLLWFEPERVHFGTLLDKEHPEWILKPQGEWSCLLDLGIPAARRYMTDLLDRYVNEAHLDWIRWDFNIGPLGFWRRADAEDRQGMAENLYIQGLYELWDELIRRHPGLVIDLCASGGRRIDLESLRRGVPLWHSDMQCDGAKPTADQLQNGGLTRWVPLHGCGVFGLEPSYAFRSAATAGDILAVAGIDKPDMAPEVRAGLRKTVALFHRLRPSMLGDFYELFPHSSAEDAWYGYQFHDASDGSGFAMVFRREKCASASARLALKGIDPGRSYEVELASGGKRSVPGTELAQLQVRLPAAPDSEIVFYRLAP